MNPVECSLADAICLSPLGGLPLVLRDRLLAGAIRVDVPASGMIYREDDVPRCALVVSGLVRVYMTSPTGREVTVRYGRRGDLLGIAALVGGPAPVNVQMLTDVTVLFLNTSTLAATARTDPAVAWLFTEDITQRLYETLGVLAHQTFGSLRQRIAGHLLDLAAGHSNGCQLFAPVTQQAIADAVGSVRPAVARIVAQLRSQGLIETSPGGVIVLDAAQLYEEVFPRVR